MNIINLTPHTINIFGLGQSGPEEIASFPSSGVARCAVVSKEIGEIAGTGIKLYLTEFGKVEGLPEPQQETIYIVSMLVRDAALGQSDLYSPGQLLRNEAGQPIGCLGLTR